jgi:hypothetical protein
VSDDRGVLPPRQALPPAQSIISDSGTTVPQAAPDPQAPGWAAIDPSAPPPQYQAALPPAAAYPAQPAYQPPTYPQYAPQAYMPSYGPQPYGSPMPAFEAPCWFTPTVQPGPVPGLVWAGVGVRFAAVVIDTVVAAVLFLVGALVADIWYNPVTGAYSTTGSIAAWITFLTPLVYMPVFWCLWRGTIGQRMLGLHVVRASDGGSLGARAATGRYLLWLLCILTVGVGVIAAVLATQNRFKKSWLDDASGSVVVRKG